MDENEESLWPRWFSISPPRKVDNWPTFVVLTAVLIAGVMVAAASRSAVGVAVGLSAYGLYILLWRHRWARVVAPFTRIGWPRGPWQEPEVFVLIAGWIFVLGGALVLGLVLADPDGVRWFGE